MGALGSIIQGGYGNCKIDPTYSRGGIALKNCADDIGQVQRQKRGRGNGHCRSRTLANPVPLPFKQCPFETLELDSPVAREQ